MDFLNESNQSEEPQNIDPEIPLISKFTRKSTNKLISTIKKNEDKAKNDSSEKKLFEILSQNPIFSSLIKDKNIKQKPNKLSSPDDLGREIKDLQDKFKTHLSNVKKNSIAILEESSEIEENFIGEDFLNEFKEKEIVQNKKSERPDKNIDFKPYNVRSINAIKKDDGVDVNFNDDVLDFQDNFKSSKIKENSKKNSEYVEYKNMKPSKNPLSQEQEFDREIEMLRNQKEREKSFVNKEKLLLLNQELDKLLIIKTKKAIPPVELAKNEEFFLKLEEIPYQNTKIIEEIPPLDLINEEIIEKDEDQYVDLNSESNNNKNRDDINIEIPYNKIKNKVKNRAKNIANNKVNKKANNTENNNENKNKIIKNEIKNHKDFPIEVNNTIKEDTNKEKMKKKNIQNSIVTENIKVSKKIKNQKSKNTLKIVEPCKNTSLSPQKIFSDFKIQENIINIPSDPQISSKQETPLRDLQIFSKQDSPLRSPLNPNTPKRSPKLLSDLKVESPIISKRDSKKKITKPSKSKGIDLKKELFDSYEKKMFKNPNVPRKIKVFF